MQVELEKSRRHDGSLLIASLSSPNWLGESGVGDGAWIVGALGALGRWNGCFVEGAGIDAAFGVRTRCGGAGLGARRLSIGQVLIGFSTRSNSRRRDRWLPIRSRSAVGGTWTPLLRQRRARMPGFGMQTAMRRHRPIGQIGLGATMRPVNRRPLRAGSMVANCAGNLQELASRGGARSSACRRWPAWLTKSCLSGARRLWREPDARSASRKS